MKACRQRSVKDGRIQQVSLLGGDSLYATAQWAMAKLHSRQFRGPVNTGTFLSHPSHCRC